MMTAESCTHLLVNNVFLNLITGFAPYIHKCCSLSVTNWYLFCQRENPEHLFCLYALIAPQGSALYSTSLARGKWHHSPRRRASSSSSSLTQHGNHPEGKHRARRITSETDNWLIIKLWYVFFFPLLLSAEQWGQRQPSDCLLADMKQAHRSTKTHTDKGGTKTLMSVCGVKANRGRDWCHLIMEHVYFTHFRQSTRDTHTHTHTHKVMELLSA